MKEKTQQISEEEYEQIKQELEEILEIQEELKLAVEEQKYKYVCLNTTIKNIKIETKWQWYENGTHML